MDRDAAQPQQQVSFSVARSAAWLPGVEGPAEWEAWANGTRVIGGDGEPALRQMPPMLRRHAARLGRMACDVAYRALDGAVGVPIVYCSRYGETARSVELLRELAQGVPMSPTAFGLSVHNAPLGLFSIARRDTASVTALAAGDATAAHGVIEACAMLTDGAEQVLVVVADCPLPPEYEPYADVLPVAFAWGWLVGPAGRDRFTLAWDDATAADGAARRQPAALDVLRFFERDDPELIHTAGNRRWHWTHRA